MYQGKRFQESLKTDNRKLAEKLYAKTLTDIIEGRYFQKPKDIRMAEVFDRYMKEISPLLSPSSHERNRQVVAHFKAILGDYLIKDVTPSVLSNFARLRGFRKSVLRRSKRSLLSLGGCSALPLTNGNCAGKIPSER
jgi:hypothetical protein